MKNIPTTAMLLAAALLLVNGVGVGCHRRGPAENAGKKIDDAAQKAKDKIDPPGPGEKAGRKIDRATGN